MESNDVHEVMYVVLLECMFNEEVAIGAETDLERLLLFNHRCY